MFFSLNKTPSLVDNLALTTKSTIEGFQCSYFAQLPLGTAMNNVIALSLWKREEMRMRIAF